MTRWRRPGDRSARAGALVAWAGVAGAVAVISVAAPVTSVTAAPALGLAFWRAALGTAVLAPWLLATRPLELARAGARPSRQAALAGVWLAVHFICLLPSLRLTSVAASTALVTTTPVWTTLATRFRGEAVPPGRAVGVGLAMVGILAVTGVDLGRSWQALAGDLLALGGGIAGAGYVVAGSRPVSGSRPSPTPPWRTGSAPRCCCRSVWSAGCRCWATPGTPGGRSR